VVQSSSWISGTTTINIDGLSLGTYNYTIILNDTTGNSVIDTVWVTVYDNSAPIFTLTASNTTVSEVSSSNYVSWVVTDLNPSTYVIYRDGSPGSPIAWSSGNTLSHGIDDLSQGIYNVTIVVSDSSGNLSTQTVWVTVVDLTAPSLISPDDIEYE
jgi:hypothetical protein